MFISRCRQTDVRTTISTQAINYPRSHGIDENPGQCVLCNLRCKRHVQQFITGNNDTGDNLWPVSFTSMNSLSRVSLKTSDNLISGAMDWQKIGTMRVNDTDNNLSPVTTTPAIIYRRSRLHQWLRIVPYFHRFHDTGNNLSALKVPSGQIGSAWEWYHWKAL